MWEHEEPGPAANAVRKQREVTATLTHFLLFIQFRTSAHGTGLPAVKVALPPQ